MGVNFNINDDGPKLEPWTSKDRLKELVPIDPEKSTPFVGEALRNLRREVGNEATVLGFIGLPFTLASYMIEGGGSAEFETTKSMMYNNPSLIHSMLGHLEENIAAYASYQIENGAQVIQVFDSWAGTLSPRDYDEFALPYQQRVIARIKKAYPDVPIIIYVAKSGGIIEKLGKSGADCISLDWTISIEEAKKRLKNPKLVIQGNLDPMVLTAPQSVIAERTNEILKAGGGHKHVMNLGHGIFTRTPEENAQFFVDTVKKYKAK
jgi:uroporphyrinogen decarboxylase